MRPLPRVCLKPYIPDGRERQSCAALPDCIDGGPANIRIGGARLHAPAKLAADSLCDSLINAVVALGGFVFRAVGAEQYADSLPGELRDFGIFLGGFLHGDDAPGNLRWEVSNRGFGV